MSEDERGQASAARLRAVAKVLARWRSQLIDVSGGNRLLFYKDLKVATLALDAAAPGGLAELLSSRPVRAGRLFPDALSLPNTVKALKAIERPARVYAEEFGLQVTYLASGFASWTAGDEKPVNAPVLMRPVNFHALPGSPDGFELTASEDMQINPVLMHYLAAEHGLNLDDADLLERFGTDEAELFDQLTKAASAALPGFSVSRRQIIANFAYASQPMVEDLGDDELEFLADSDMVAALAGSAEASELVITAGQGVSPEEPDHCPPSDEHLILDADGSQSYVINAIVAGQHLVVQGPPGSGKTQTITNTIAELVARGKTVLFVAQKRAAITAVLGRLEDAGLDGLLLDLFDGASSRKRVVQELGRRLESSKITPRPNVGALQDAYSDARSQLVAHRTAMHEVRPPWGITLLGSKSDGVCEDGFYDWTVYAAHEDTPLRLDIRALQAWTPETHEALRRAIRELRDRGGLEPDALTRPGWDPATIVSSDVLQDAEATAHRLKDQHLKALEEQLDTILGSLQIAPPAPLTVNWSQQLLVHLGNISAAFEQDIAAILSPAALPDPELGAWLHATGDKAYRSSSDLQVGMFARRKLRKTIDAVLPQRTSAEQHAGLVTVWRLREAWRSFTSAAFPASTSATWRAAAQVQGLAAADLNTLSNVVQGRDLNDLDALPDTLTALLTDRSRASLPRRHALLSSLVKAGCGPVLDELMLRPAGPGDWDPADRLTTAFVRTVIEHLDRTDPRLAGVESADLNRATGDFQTADRRLREANASRVRRAAAEGLMAALDAHPDQAERLRGQVKRKRGFLPIRRLMDDIAPDVVLAAKPVWAASPQTVSQLLPTRRLFDVVLFDEASQVLPAAAIPAIARGTQVVVAGDDLQLPPTTLFTRTAELDEDSMKLDEFESGDDDEPRAEPELTAEIPDTESILDAISVKLGTQRSRYLAWHYRSRDEKLIATSNEFLYRPAGRMMTTFPAADSSDALRLVQCPPSTGLGRTNLSPTGEVAKVVDLMLEHGRQQASSGRPSSLGVIAFGGKHAARIEREFEQRLPAESEAVRGFFATEGSEKYFIKNIERVQGDERDVIILSIGYAKGTNGKLSYHWGPVQQEGGHRRVNVAISRARSQMTLVTSFGPGDVDPNYSQAPGFQLMRRFLEYASTGGASFGDEGAQHVPCNPFEADIQRRLEERGLTVIPQWGVGGYRIDFAIQHPDQPGRFVLAVEADGASYHSGTVARERDRLRQQLLEARGWTFVRIWSSDFFFDPEPEIQRVVDAYERAITHHARAVADDQETLASTAAGAPRPLPTAPPPHLPDWDESQARRKPFPAVSRGLKVNEYTDHSLRRVVSWVLSDDLPYARADLFEETKRALGFERNGRVIVERINAAIDVVLRERSTSSGGPGNQ